MINRWGMVGIVVVIGILALGSAQAQSPLVRPVVDGGIPSYVAKANLSGAIAVAGSDTMQPMVARIASSFKQSQPDVKIAVQGGGSDAALSAFVQGIAASRRGDGNVRGHLSSNDVDLLASSRPLTAEERRDFQSRHGYEPVEIPIALDTVAIYVNRDNPVQGLTMEQLDAIFGKTRKRGMAEDITTWGQVGLPAAWAQQPIHLYGRDKRSGTRHVFVQEVLLGGDMKPTVREEPGPAMEILDISRDATGIGYAGIGFQASTVRIVPLAIRSGQSFVFPAAQTAADGSYPLARTLYLYAKKGPKADIDPPVMEFLRFINSREGQDIVAKTGYFPLSGGQILKNLYALTGAPISASTTELKMQ
jgi:phosphate transport system substrate-binding protein